MNNKRIWMLAIFVIVMLLLVTGVFSILGTEKTLKHSCRVHEFLSGFST